MSAQFNSDRLGIKTDRILYSQGDFEEVAAQIPYAKERSSHLSNQTSLSLRTHLHPKIVTHIPYGKQVQLSKKQLADIYFRFGQLLKKRPDFKEVYVLSGNPDFKKASQQNWKNLIHFSNRGIEVEVLKLIVK